MKSVKILFLSVCVFQFLCSFGQVKLPKLISNGVVFQRNAEVKIWGWAAPQEKVSLEFNSEVYKATADENGNWSMVLPAQKAGGPHQMVFTASNEIVLNDILFGDVWVCSGQSNMELPMDRVRERYGDVIGASNNTNIRQFLVPDKFNFKAEAKDFDSGNWVAASPENVLDFSAVAYFFALKVYESEGVPIGLINSALGGSPVESWLSEEALKNFPEALAEAQKFKDDDLIKRIQQKDKKTNDDWYELLKTKDEGISGKVLWSDFNFDDSLWKTMNIPGYWDNTGLGSVNGSVWFRKTINLPKEMADKPAKLILGRMVDQDFVYVNGHFVGTTGYQYPPRRYEIAPHVLKEGKNTIAIRLINHRGQGGFVLDKPYFLQVGQSQIDLKGEWKFKLGAEMDALPGQTFIRWKPLGLFNAMIAPLLNLNIKGVLWYQGESNTGNPKPYAETFPALIENWRSKWKQDNFPFLYVQLANFMEAKPEPTESHWAQLRQYQLETLKVPNTGMAVAIDTGEWNDVHPTDKKNIGDRLALLALKNAYGKENITAYSPMPTQASFKKNKVSISFKNIGSGLVVKKGTALKSFAISNDGKHFEWAKAEINGHKIIVSNKTIKNPIVVRYGWADNPTDANLFSKEGLPATPFEIKKD